MSYLPYSPCAGSIVYFSAYDAAGVATWPYAWWDFGDGASGSGMTTTHVYSVAGTYSGLCFVYDSLTWSADTLYFTITVDPACAGMDYVEGSVFYDDNGNGVMDGSEYAIPGEVVSFTGGSLPGPAYVSTNSSGKYGVNLPAGSYTISYATPAWGSPTAPAGGTYSFTSTGGGATTYGQDFGYEADSSYIDLSVYACCGGHVPGFDRNFWAYYQNNGPTPQPVTVTWTHDPAVTYVSSVGGVYAAGTVTWNVGIVPPFGDGWVNLTLHTPAALALGTPIHHDVAVNIPVGEMTPANNEDDLDLVVVGSYDPNDKKASPVGTVEPGQQLDYTIRFQNTGTYPATNVILRDTLDGDLDLATLKVLGASHAHTWHLDGNILVFEFMGIMLPDSNTNEPASHGFASYSVNAKSSITPGTEVTNSASIYFDFNAPIVTNTTVNTYTVTAIVDADATLGLEVFPNPFNESATLRFDNPTGEEFTLTVMDLNGKVVRQVGGNHGTEITLQRGNLSAGLYLFRLEGANSIASGKLIVE